MDIRGWIGQTFAPGAVKQFEAKVETACANLDLVTESVATLAQLALEDSDYERIGENHGAFMNPAFIKNLIMRARLFYIKNPIIRRGVKIQCFYTFGKGYTVTSPDESTQVAIDKFLAANDKLLGSVGISSLESKMQCDGNLFIAAFTDENQGTVTLRKLEPLQIERILCDPEDADTELAYLRSWSVTDASGRIETRKQWYPAMLADQAKLAMLGLRDVPIATGVVVYHQAIETIGSSAWGIPEFYAALDWAQAYKIFLEGWATIQAVFRGLGYQINTKGGNKAIEGIKDALKSSISTGNPVDRNPMQTGTAAVMGPDSKIAAIKSAGATEGPEEARRLFLMAAMVFGFPETMFGDVSVGTLATAVSLDRPTELKILEVQGRWKVLLRTIIEYAVQNAATAPGGELRPKRDQLQAQREANTQAYVVVEFPDILEHEIDKTMSAIVKAATLDGKALAGTMDIKTVALLTLRVLGADDPEGIVEAMYPKDDYDPIEWASATPEEKAQQAADLADKALQVSKKQTNATQESAVLEMAGAALQLVREVKSARGDQ